MEAAPRRYAPSAYPDLNQPNAVVLLGLGGALILVGLILFFVAFGNAKGASDVPLIGGGIVLIIGGGLMMSMFPAKMKQHRDRAANLIENGAPVMARIVKVDNSTGDSEFGRLVTYMITLPGENEETRREVKVDDRCLPKRIPGPATALIDFRTSDIELYCALPFVAVSKNPQPASNDSPIPNGTPATSQSQSQSQTQTPFPTMPSTPPPTPTGGMAPLSGMGTTPVAPTETEDKPKETKRGGGAAKLPWEN
jgi:flagellar basal body-associated protein FliL